ncbi:MAG: SusC/RagA family TonB-linked outer membrane protein [Lunatimonas sp.]|uniref:SusC/RagA family TonB-linked outer membrane protein n=1 Tax=Lunatimonas sp. TaxID=2060141 RepID=UPI00263AF48F|nr:SusC/RagA family TonB-linked outer membrane protein [Lunatimonas sp.]MCC5936854.1 SusC/RagA family TonB-linked outer membrane protein [Lunatimonas sp.]
MKKIIPRLNWASKGLIYLSIGAVTGFHQSLEAATPTSNTELLTTSLLANEVDVTVTGIVTDEGGEPIPGVTLFIAGTGVGTVTDIDGKYSLTVPEGSEITVSYVGFITQVIQITNQSQLNITLLTDMASLEEVVVIGYGTARKRDLTGAVSSVTATRLENENPNSVQDILRGNAAGLNVGLNTSAKGGGNLEVRGRTSLNAGGSPLIVLDGAIYYGQLADINPNDIETLDVLKDASSAAVFGAKAANGVILITTKRGTLGKPTIKINTNWGTQGMSKHEPVYDGAGFISWREDVMKSIFAGGYEPYRFSNPNTLPSDISLDTWMSYDGSEGDPETVWLQRLNMQPLEIANFKRGQETDWYSMMFQNGLRQDHTVSLAGRSEDFQYYWSMGYLDNDGLIVGDKFTTIRSRFNIEGKVNKWLTVGMNTQFADRDESQVPVAWGNLVNLSPWAEPFMEDGSLRFMPNEEVSGGRHPYYTPGYTDRLQKETTINSTLYAALELPLGFKFRTNFTPRYEFYERYNHESAQHQDFGPMGGRASRQQRKVYFWQVDNILSWNKSINDIHNFDFTFLANAEKFQSWDNTMTNNGFEPHDRLGFHNIGAGINPIISSNDQYHTADALMGRMIYSFNDKYVTTVSVRRDGYSAFGQSNPRATFTSAAFAWLFTDEDFINIPWLDYGKIRASWGSNGNRDIGRYAALSNLQTGKYFYQRPNGQLYFVSQLYVNSMENRNLRWERTTSVNLGLDFSLFNSVLDGTLELYDMSTTDLLVQRRLPDILGFDFVWDNLGEVRNRGVELTLNSLNLNRANVTWRSNLNFQLNRNRIVSLYGDLDEDGRELDDIGNRWFIGRAIDEIWDYRTQGIWQSDEADQAAAYGVRPGDFKVEDVNNDGVFTNADRQFLGFTEPRSRWSLRNEFKLFNNFDLSFMMYAYWGHMGTFNQRQNRQGFLDRSNSHILPYWTAENPNNEWARLYSSQGGSSPLNVYVMRSFIRFENVSMAYTIPKNIVNQFSIQNLRVYGNIRNLGFFAPEFNFWDPETAAPTPRLFTLGLDITL